MLSVLLRRGLYRRWGKSVFHAEDQDGADENKLYLVTPAGTNKAGDHYQGCFGFTWIFTHDNYRYLSRRDDNLVKSCPNCEGTHDHRPFEEAGTNECGVTVSATQSLYPNEEILAADPFAQTGINEAEIATVLLSEAALQGEEEKETFAETSLAELQQKYISAFPDLTARLAAEPDLQARKEIMTREHMQMSEEAQTLALKLYRYLVCDV